MKEEEEKETKTWMGKRRGERRAVIPCSPKESLRTPQPGAAWAWVSAVAGPVPAGRARPLPFAEPFI